MSYMRQSKLKSVASVEGLLGRISEYFLFHAYLESEDGLHLMIFLYSILAIFSNELFFYRRNRAVLGLIVRWYLLFGSTVSNILKH